MFNLILIKMKLVLIKFNSNKSIKLDQIKPNQINSNPKIKSNQTQNK